MEIVTCLQKSAELTIRLMPQSAETVPVEMQAAELPFLPFAAAANVASAPVQFIFPVFLLFFLPVNRIGKGMPGKRHLPAKAQSKQIRLILIIPRRHRCPPYLCEQALRQSPVPADDQRLRKFFSRKHTAEEFRDYVRTNSMDFVQYMVQVCLNPAGTDNTRRFEEINHIMSTIAIISNSVEQQLYTQELASILGMKEDIVARSIAAARKRYVEEKIRARNAVTYAQSSQANADPQVLKDPMDFKNLKDSTAPSPAKKGEQETVFLRKIEQNFLEIAQMIVEHGNEKYADNEDGTYLPIGMFLINGLREDGMLPQNPLVGKVLSEYESHFTDPGFDTVQWFTLHSDQELASFVASIISNETSENYAKDAYVLLNALKFNICDMRLKTEKNMAPEVRQALLAARASFDRKRKK